MEIQLSHMATVLKCIRHQSITDKQLFDLFLYLSNSSRQDCSLECVARKTIIDRRLKLRRRSAILCSIGARDLVQITVNTWAALIIRLIILDEEANTVEVFSCFLLRYKFDCVLFFFLCVCFLVWHANKSIETNCFFFVFYAVLF